MFSPLLALASSCSLVYDLSPDQCGETSDCKRFGQSFVCENGLCKDKAPPGDGGTSGTAGSSGRGSAGTNPSGGSGNASGTGGTGGTLSDGGEAGDTGGSSSSGKGGSSGKAGSSGESGEGGDGGDGGGPVIECESHAECFDLYDDSNLNPRACVENRCVPLRTDECPVVLPLADNNNYDALISTDAIILGGFAPLLNGQPDTITRNYDLAMTELMDKAHGVYAGSGQRRQVVMVVCDMLYGTRAELLVPARHLINDLGVKGIVSTLLLTDQRYVYEQIARPNGVFMMMPLYSEQALIDEPDDGLIWHMLSGADALSVSYQPLLDLIRAHITTLGELGAEEDMKLFLVNASDETFLADTSAYFIDNIKFNDGKSVSENLADGNFDSIVVDSVFKSPNDPQTDAIADILAMQPHVVMGATVSEMLTKIIPNVEAGWDAATSGRPRPFYLLGALGYNDPNMPGMLLNDKSTMAGQIPLHQRILGISWPAAEDRSIYDDYQVRYQTVFGSPEPFYENYYDATYYLLYGLAAARQPLTGAKIAQGLLRVTEGTTEVEVGPNNDMNTYITALNNDTTLKIKLIGAQGPPTWDEFGARNDPGGVWCVTGGGVYHPDVMRFDASDSTLTGMVDCFPFPVEP